jgi:CHAT domain-containing protein
MALVAEREPLAKLADRDSLALSPEQEARLAELDQSFTAACQRFQQTLDAIKATFAALSDERRQELAQKQLLAGKDDRGLVRDLGAFAKSEVALLHTLVLADKVQLLLTLPEVLLARQSAVGEAELNRQVQALRAALQDPHQDPRGPAQTLYQALIAPLAADLEAAGVHTLMVSLDGALRYLPLAALYDGQQYLAERYALSVFTDAARDNLKQAPTPQWSGVGLGVSLPHRDVGPTRHAFGALPTVPAELKGIFRGASADNPAAVLPGRYFLDADFTPAILRKALRAPVLHIASHFSLQPGNESQSFLLLGDGSALELRQLRTDNYDFGRVDLLTLSACETAVGGRDAQGKEVEGLGTLAQAQGAKGVIATLWPVADASTGLFMQQLYRLRVDQGLSKAEALRQAQLAFLRGDAAGAPAGDTDTRQPVRLSGEPATAGDDSPGRFTPDPQHPYAHPYYWAPFILMGNWL